MSERATTPRVRGCRYHAEGQPNPRQRLNNGLSELNGQGFATQRCTSMPRSLRSTQRIAPTGPRPRIWYWGLPGNTFASCVASWTFGNYRPRAKPGAASVPLPAGDRFAAVGLSSWTLGSVVRDRTGARHCGKLRIRQRSLVGVRLSAACRASAHRSFERESEIGMVRSARRSKLADGRGSVGWPI